MSKETEEAIEILENFVARGRYQSHIGDVDQALTKLREAPEPPESIKKVIAILDKEEYEILGEYMKSQGVKDAIAKLRSITAPEQPPAREGTKQIPLTQGKYALVDAKNYEMLSKHKWYASCTQGRWYAQREIKNEEAALAKEKEG